MNLYGINWQPILAEILALGEKLLPILLQLLPLLLATDVSKLTPPQVEAWLLAVVKALVNHQPIPPVPTP